MQKILITGISGTGKTTTCKALKEMGYSAIDIENQDGMFEMVHKGTMNVFVDYDNLNPEHIKSAEWVCNLYKLKKLLDSHNENYSFYSGIASNMDVILPLFDKFIVLYLSSEDLNNRLKNRENTTDIGNNQEGRDVILGWKDWWEGEMKKKGGIFINSTKSPKEVAKKILEAIN